MYANDHTTLALTVEQRMALCREHVTLNGQPARVSGVALSFARVTQIGSGLSAEWSWATVEHVVRTKGGAFES